MADLIPLSFSAEQIQIMKKTVAAGVSDADFLFFLEVCKARGLNPFNREIYAIPRGGKMTIQVGIDGLRILAERTQKYRGQLGPYFCGGDGQWREEWLEDAPPVAAKVGVLRDGFEKPIWAVARYKAYNQENNPLWKKMPDVLLSKCSEALALRKAFPQAMAGLYAHEEMMQADRAVESARVQAPLVMDMYVKCRDAGLCSDADAFYAFCSQVLQRHVTRKEAAKLTPDERMHIDQALESEIAQRESIVVEAEPGIDTHADAWQRIYADGLGKGLWRAMNGFCAFASAELGINVSEDSVKSMSADMLGKLARAVEEEKPVAQPA